MSVPGPSRSSSENRQGLATILFKGVKTLRELPDGLALGYPDQPAWAARLAEFIRLEQEAGVKLGFNTMLDDGLLWLQCFGDTAALKTEMFSLSPELSPLGRITMLKAEPRVSVIVLAIQTSGEEITRMAQTILDQVRSPLEVILVTDARLPAGRTDKRIAVVISRTVDFRRSLDEAKGSILAFMEPGMPVELLPKMIELVQEYPIVIGSHPERHRLGNRFARLILGGEINDYLTHFIVLRRSVLTSAPVLPAGDGAYFVDLLVAARRQGLRVCELPCQHPYRLPPQLYLRRILSAR